MIARRVAPVVKITATRVTIRRIMASVRNVSLVCPKAPFLPVAPTEILAWASTSGGYLCPLPLAARWRPCKPVLAAGLMGNVCSLREVQSFQAPVWP